jgi:dihydrofolate reductase
MKAIVCINKNMGIGKSGNIPWKCSKDMKYFKRITMGKGRNAVVMGFTTFLSLGGKPLKGRRNYVLTKDPQKAQIFFEEDVIFESSITNILLLPHIFEDVFIIGGEEIYKLFSKYYTEIYLTEINDSSECDKYFLLENWDDYEVEKEENDKEGDVEIKFYKLKRKKSINSLEIEDI